MKRLAVLAAATTLLACFDVPVQSGEIACSEDDRCPGGLDCIGGLCLAPGTVAGDDAGPRFDGAIADSGMVDATSPIDGMQPLGAFGTPTVLTSLDAAGQLEDDPSITADGLELFYNRNNIDIYVTTRATTEAPWGAPTDLTGLGDADAPYILPDGLTMYFASARLGSFDIFRATRADRASAWGAPQVIGTPISIGGTFDEHGPCVTANELVLIFAADRVTDQVFHLYRSERATTAEPWSAPTAIAGIVGADGVELDCWVSDDEQHLYFGSDRSGGVGAVNIWRAVGDGNGNYGSVTEVAELSTATATTADAFLSADLRTIYFSKQLPGEDGDLNVAER